MKHAHHVLSFSFVMDDMDEIFLRVLVSNGETTSHALTTCRLRLRQLSGGEGFRVFQLPVTLVSDHVTYALNLTFTECNTMLIVREEPLW